MTDKEYKVLVEWTMTHRYVYKAVLDGISAQPQKRSLWLRLIGLMETRDITNDHY